jgi:predicted DNA-binding protein
MKIFLEPERTRIREKKVMYSTSLPKGLKDSLQKAVIVLHRTKSEWIRTSLNLFLVLSEQDQNQLILDTYQKMDSSHLRPFTTTLLESQLMRLNLLARTINRSKAEILRTAIFIFLSKSPAEQEKTIKTFLSR